MLGERGAASSVEPESVSDTPKVVKGKGKVDRKKDAEEEKE